MTGLIQIRVRARSLKQFQDFMLAVGDNVYELQEKDRFDKMIVTMHGQIIDEEDVDFFTR